MKKLTLLIAILSVFISTSIFAMDNNLIPIQQMSEKIYLRSENIYIGEEGIFAYQNDNWMQIDALYTDRKGVYAKKGDIIRTWLCHNCNFRNHIWKDFCEKCSYPKGYRK